MAETYKNNANCQIFTPKNYVKKLLNIVGINANI